MAESMSADQSVSLEPPFESASFPAGVIHRIQTMSRTGRYEIRGWGAKRYVPSFDDLTFVTASASRYPLEGYREACDTKTVLGSRFASKPLELDIPITIAGMSFGSLSAHAKDALGRVAQQHGDEPAEEAAANRRDGKRPRQRDEIAREVEAPLEDDGERRDEAAREEPCEHAREQHLTRVLAVEEQHVRLHALRVEDPCGQTQERVHVRLLEQLAPDGLARAALEQHVVRQHHRRAPVLLEDGEDHRSHGEREDNPQSQSFEDGFGHAIMEMER